MKLLDLFCGAGGAATGYHRAGFDDITGVDSAPQRRYPYRFIEADALDYVATHGRDYDVLHASPPCQAHSALKGMWNARQHEDFLPQTRQALKATGKPYVIENVVGAPLDVTLMLCGSMFGLETLCGAQLRRHRLFESNVMLMSPGACQHGRQTISVHGAVPRDPSLEVKKYKHRTITVTGETAQQNVVYNQIRETFSIDAARCAMGIDWMVMSELSQAIPPVYTEWIGRQLLRKG